jgi:hypothetical protein
MNDSLDIDIQKNTRSTPKPGMLKAKGKSKTQSLVFN